MSTFHPFPRLPLELRLAIWEMTVGPREVEVRIVEPTPEDRLQVLTDAATFREAMSKIPEAGESTRAGRKFRNKAQKAWKPFQPCIHMVSSTIPAALHSCREARNHELYQQISLDVDNQHGAGRRYVWLNLEINLLDIGTSDLTHFKPIAPAIKRLKFSRTNKDEHWYHFEKTELQKLINVTEVHEVCIDGFWNWGDDVYNFPWPCPLENLVFIDQDEGDCVDYIEIRRRYRMVLRKFRLASDYNDCTTDEEVVD